MASKIQTLTQLATDTTSRLTASFAEWTAFLQTAARLYKYPYSEQVFIYAQRPEATACAGFDVWNQRMGRAVRRGSKGIAIVDTSRGAPQVKYVFDIADTVERQNARKPYLWELTEENQKAVAEALADHYDVSTDIGLAWQLEEAARQLAEESWQENQADILASAEGSFLEELDEENIHASFCDACTSSTLYVLLARCGLDPDSHLQHEDFLSVFDFNTPAAATALGTAVSQGSEKVLRQIEVTIKNFERERRKEHGRIDIQAGGELSAPGIGDREASESGQVWPAAAGVPGGASPDILQPADPGGDIGPASDGDRPDGEPAIGIAAAADPEVHGDHGEPESPRPHEVGGADEQREASGGGDDIDGAGVQLEDGFGQFSLFGGGDYKPLVNNPRFGGEAITLRPQVSQEVIDEALRIGANDPQSRLRIIAEFMKDNPLEENIRFLQAHYKENGAGFYVGERKYALWYDDTGMLISPGESARRNFATALSWEQAAGRIRELLDAGEYASQLMLYRAWPFERGRVAEALVHMQGDIADDARDRYFPTLRTAFQDVLGHPDRLNKVKELVQEPGSLQKLVDECGAFLADYAHNRDLLRFRYHKTDEILQGLKDLQSDPIKFAASEDFTPQRRFFISQDEIDKLLREGPDHNDYRIGVYKFFEQHPDKSEREKYLWDLHGVYSGVHGGNDNILYTPKQLEFSHGSITDPYAKVELKWSTVRKRIEELIAKDAFLSAEDKEILESRYLEQPADELEAAPTVRDLYGKYKSMVVTAAMQDEAYRNACRNSDEESAHLECDAAIKRFAAAASDLQFAKLYYDMSEFHTRLHREVWEETHAALYAPEQEAQSRYQVVVYHHFENGFDEKLDYQTFAEAEKAAQRYLDGSMEADGFQYEGAAVYDLQEKKWLRVFGDFPDEKAQEQVKNTPSAEAVAEHAAPSPPVDPGRPYIFCEWSESEVFQDKIAYPLSEFDRRMKEADSHHAAKKAEGIKKYGSWQAMYDADDPAYSPYLGYDKVKFTLHMPDGSAYTECQDIGDGDGGVIDFLSQYEKYREIVPALREKIEQENREQAAATMPAPRDPQTPAYKVGDTVYLDDTTFIIEDIGRFNVHLRDPSLAYPISRAESKERFEQLLRRDERNDFITNNLPTGPQPPYTTTVTAVYPAEKNNMPYEIIVEKLHIPGQEKPAPAPNFRITDEHLGVGGAKAHYKMNVEAIRLLRQLQAENRQATPDEQAILSIYVGWGGLADAFDENKPAWASEYKELQELLSPEEYASARGSTLNAHYTIPVVIRAMYQALENMGFQGGNILEPSMGVGNFFG